jgi:hypothetical protein
MPRNYDTTQHKIYPRVPSVTMQYAESGIPVVEYTERDAVVDGDGAVRHINGGGIQVAMQFDALPDTVQCVNPATGESIPGMMVTKQQVMLGVLAFVRADQLRRDAEAGL